MVKWFLRNFLKKRKLVNDFSGKTILGLWGSEQIKKLKNLGQELVIMRMG